jgi:hypothetical protein
VSHPPESPFPSRDGLGPTLGELDLDFLRAASDLAQHQTELSELLSTELGTSPYEYWISARVDAKPPAATLKREYRNYEQAVRIGDWEAFFHGLECDVEHVHDGRFVRIDFGPRIRPIALSGFGVLQYVMCVCEPWRPFPALREWLAERGPPYDSLSGSHRKMTEIWARLADANLVEQADPHLCSRRSEFEVFAPDLGRTVLRLPDASDVTGSDLMLCGRAVLSPLATTLLSEAGQASL